MSEEVNLVDGEWHLVLTDGRKIPFYLGNSSDDTNPLEKIPEFNQGKNWSVDIGSQWGFPLDQFESSFYLVPKAMVQEVVFIKYENAAAIVQPVDGIEYSCANSNYP